MKEIRAVAVAESLDPKTGAIEMIQCIGVFESFANAYGEAMIYLTEYALGIYGDRDKTECTISVLQNLEGDTGFGMYLEDKAGEILHAVFILHVDGGDI